MIEGEVTETVWTDQIPQVGTIEPRVHALFKFCVDPVNSNVPLNTHLGSAISCDSRHDDSLLFSDGYSQMFILRSSTCFFPLDAQC